MWKGKHGRDEHPGRAFSGCIYLVVQFVSVFVPGGFADRFISVPVNSFAVCRIMGKMARYRIPSLHDPRAKCDDHLSSLTVYVNCEILIADIICFFQSSLMRRSPITFICDYLTYCVAVCLCHRSQYLFRV